jgi:hypothetical protein
MVDAGSVIIDWHYGLFMLNYSYVELNFISHLAQSMYQKDETNSIEEW